MISTLLSLVILIHLASSSDDLTFHNNYTTLGIEDPVILEKVHGNILCRSCGNEVASSSDLISKFTPYALYSFRDTIFDKDDVLVQGFVGDFILDYPVIITSVSNCEGVQKWEEVDSWFPGYRWKPCVCPDCGEYIGWVFEPKNPGFVETPTTFFGLILTSLIGESCKYTLTCCQLPDCDSRRIVKLKMSTTDMSTEDKEFLASCEEEFKERYTVNDKEFMKVFKSEPSTSPIMESWWVPQNSSRRNDRRQHRRTHPYERNSRDYDRRDRRGYNEDNRGDRGSRGDEGGYRNHSPRRY